MINFETKNEGTWFWFNEDNQEEGGICLRILSGDEYERITKITTKTKKRVKQGVAYDDTTVDEKLAAKKRWDYCIVDWKNVSIDGEAAECDSVNKQRLVKSFVAIKFINDCLDKLNEEASIDNEARVKNFESSSDGNSEDTAAAPV